MKTHAERFRHLLEVWGLTQEELGNLCGIKRGTVGTIVNGKTTPDADALAELLRQKPDLSPDWLLTGNGPMLRDGRVLTPAASVAAEPAAPSIAGPFLSHTNLSPEEIGKLLMKVASLEARAEAAEREAAKYWTVVERYAGKKTEGNRVPAATEAQTTQPVADPAPRPEVTGYKRYDAAATTECVVRQLVPELDSVSITPSYMPLQKAL